MKKFFTFLLCAALTLGLIACSNNTPAEEAKWKARQAEKREALKAAKAAEATEEVETA